MAGEAVQEVQKHVDDVEGPDGLLEWARQYARRVVDEHDMAVDLDAVEFEVDTSDRRKTRAADMEFLELPVRTRPGVPIDWERVRENVPLPEGYDDHQAVTITLTWAAFESSRTDAEDCRGTVKHELIHAEHFQRYGTADHGAEFEARADEIDAPRGCVQWRPAKYILRCEECEGVVGKRFRASSVTKSPDEYQSRCCGAPLTVEDGENGGGQK